MKTNPISPKSKSFLRQEDGKSRQSSEKKFAYGVNIPQEFLNKNSKSTLRDWMIRFHNDKCVVNADLLNIKTLQEIKHIKKDLGERLSEKFKDTKYKGIIDFHPTSDSTCNTGHIHYWGSGAKEMERVISEYVVEKGLSVTQRAEDLRITSSKFKIYDKNIENKKNRKNIEEKSLFFNIEDKLTKESEKLIQSADEALKNLQAQLSDLDNYLIKPKKEEDKKIKVIKKVAKKINKKRIFKRNFTKLFDEFVFKFEKNFGKIRLNRRS